MQNAFSEESLRRISEALDSGEKTCPHFSCSVSENELCAREGWGQGIDIYGSEGKYYCRHYRERSTAVEVLENEEAAVTRFIRYCKLVMRQPL